MGGDAALSLSLDSCSGGWIPVPMTWFKKNQHMSRLSRGDDGPGIFPPLLSWLQFREPSFLELSLRFRFVTPSLTPGKSFTFTFMPTPATRSLLLSLLCSSSSSVYIVTLFYLPLNQQRLILYTCAQTTETCSALECEGSRSGPDLGPLEYLHSSPLTLIKTTSESQESPALRHFSFGLQLNPVWTGVLSQAAYLSSFFMAWR